MRRALLALTALTALSALSLALVQERVKKKQAADFGALHEELGEAWKAGRYGRSMDLARELMGLIGEKRTEVILAAMPAAPEGFEAVPRKPDANAANPFANALAGFGNVIEQKYRESGGRGQVDVTVTADSPLVQMFKMWAANPAMLGPDAEMIKYERFDAVLRKEGARWSLQILFGDDLCEAKVSGRDDEFLLKLFDQAAVDKLAAALEI